MTKVTFETHGGMLITLPSGAIGIAKYANKLIDNNLKHAVFLLANAENEWNITEATYNRLMKDVEIDNSIEMKT